MILISLYNNNKIVSSETEAKDINIVLGFIFKKYVQGEDISSDFDSKLLYIEDEQLKSRPLNRKVKTFRQEGDSVDVLIQFESLAREYEGAYIFDQYELFQYVDNDYRDLDPQEYELKICKHCGKITNQLVNDYCPECFVSVGVQEIFDQIQTDDKELYTEYETISKVMNVVEKFYGALRGNGEAAFKKAEEISVNFLQEENVPKDLYETILGGFVA